MFSGRTRLIVAVAAACVSWAAAAAQDRLAAFAEHNEAGAAAVDHEAWDVFLSRYVSLTRDGRTVVDYAAVGDADRTALKAYITALNGVDPTALARNEAFAYWANLYNALTVDIVLAGYPVESILNIKSGLRAGPWRRQATIVNGVTLTLDDIEHGILRAHWSDNRVHYALNCASVGCPNLPQRAFRGAALDAMLDAGARAYVNHPRGVRIIGDRVIVASIYKWFIEDFGGDNAGILAHVTKYAEPALRVRLGEINKISKFDYDWKLNDIGS